MGKVLDLEYSTKVKTVQLLNTPPSQPHKFTADLNLPPQYPKCKTEMGSLTRLVSQDYTEPVLYCGTRDS